MKSFCWLLLFLLFSSCFEDKSRMMVDGKMEPPVPDESKNNETIGGIDSNNDGVRDDIERWINRKFPGEENYNKRMAWKQLAKSIRNVQINSMSEKEAVKYLYGWNNASSCTLYVYSVLNKEGLREKFKIGDKILEMSNNTKTRIERWMFADKSFAGKAYASPSYSKLHSTCHFNINKK